MPIPDFALSPSIRSGQSAKIKHAGQSLLEVILALAIFALISSAMITMVVGSFAGLNQGGKLSEAEALAQEGVEAVRAIRDRAWNEAIYEKSAVSASSGQWQFLGENTVELIGDYTRSITFENVCRDISDKITLCPGVYSDLSTRKVSVEISWKTLSGTTAIERITYLSNWDSKDWIQTDWSGGAGQVIWADITRFDSATNIEASSIGEISLQEGATWVAGGGTEISDRTDADFNQGTFTDTVINGVGETATVVLIADLGIYRPSGVFQSRAVDSGDTTTVWSSIRWTEILPNGSNITIAVRTGNTTIPDATWSAWSVENTNSLGSSINPPDARYIQYRATFTRGADTTQTPQLDDVTVIFNPPTRQNINDIKIVSANDIWAVADRGEIIHYDGIKWDPVTSPITSHLNGLYMVSAADGWAVGASGKILRYNGTSWASTISPITVRLNSLYMVSAADGWAVGASGKILRYNGTSWTEYTDIGADELFDVYMVSASDGWAVGENGIVYRWNGSNWSLNIDIGQANLNGLFMASSTMGGFVGDRGIISSWDGLNWTLHTDTGNQYWNDLHMFIATTTSGWVVGNQGAIWKYQNNLWSRVTSPTARTLNSIAMDSEKSGWAVGEKGTIIRFTNLTGTNFELDGSLLSSAFNMGDASPLTNIEWDEIIPLCSPACLVQFELSAAPDLSGSPGAWTAWYGPDGPGTKFATSTGSLIPQDLNGNQWVRYQVYLTGDGAHTPIVKETIINYK